MTENDKPDWLDETKLKKATFASRYTGWVVDLGDGTCRLANDPMLGENGPSWGDRVDLFFNPCDPDELPFIGYRIYPLDIVVPGRHFGVRASVGPEDHEDCDDCESCDNEEDDDNNYCCGGSCGCD